MKPECDVHNRQSTKNTAQIERNLPLLYSQGDTTCYTYVLKRKTTSLQVKGLDSNISHTCFILKFTW